MKTFKVLEWLGIILLGIGLVIMIVEDIEAIGLPEVLKDRWMFFSSLGLIFWAFGQMGQPKKVKEEP